MIVDVRQIDVRELADCDICIVGAGAAGISLALALDATALRICVLEAGGRSYEPATQRLFAGEAGGEHYAALRDTRLGALGGSTSVWAGWCRPLDEIDFEARPWLGAPGWPFTQGELLPYYRRAHEVCGLADCEYDAELWEKRLGYRRLLAGDETITNVIFHVNAQRFGSRYRHRLEASTNIQLVLNAPATRCDLSAATHRVERVQVRTLAGHHFAVRARCFVLAAGGIENARLLLLSADRPGNAPGNTHQLVGRYFTDHPFVDLGSLIVDGPPRALDYYLPQRSAGMPAGATVRGAFALGRAALEQERLPNAAIFLYPRYESHAVFARGEVKALLLAWDKLRHRAVPGEIWPHISRAVRAPGAIALAAMRKIVVRHGPANHWRLRAMFETESRLDNRTTLSSETDALGRSRPRVEWQLSEGDLKAMSRIIQLFDRAMQRAGIGRVQVAFPDRRAAWRKAAESGKHHMGTTRMHSDPARGVVDENARVHGTPNLFVAGSSVFPSGGYANPTLTIVALALRLADHLKKELLGEHGGGSETAIGCQAHRSEPPRSPDGMLDRPS